MATRQPRRGCSREDDACGFAEGYPCSLKTTPSKRHSSDLRGELRCSLF